MTDPIRPDPCSSPYVLPVDSDWARTERAEEAAPTTLDHVGEVALEVPLAVGTAVDVIGAFAHLHPLVEALSPATVVFDFYASMYHVAGQAPRGVSDSLLREAFAGATPGTRFAHLAAIAELDSREVAALARQLAPHDRVEMARRTHDLAARMPDPHFRQGLRVAREAYAGIVRDFNAGATAAVLGRGHAPRTDAGESGQAWAERVRREDPSALQRMRALALACRDDGVLGAAHDRVDESRYARDAAYRLGVDEARAMGEQALETAARRIESDRRGTVRGSALCPAMG